MTPVSGTLPSASIAFEPDGCRTVKVDLPFLRLTHIAWLLVLALGCGGAERGLELQQAHVGIDIEGSGHAIVGRTELPAGERVRLYAILQAVDRDGAVVYFSEAEAITLDGAEVDPASIRSWEGRRLVKNLWSTVEGSAPYTEIDTVENLRRFRVESFSHPEWGNGWVAEATVRARRDDALELEQAERLSFGTQHYQVWVELFDDEAALVPGERYKSAGPEQLLADPASFPAVEMHLEGALDLPSRKFGLSFLQPTPEAPAEVRETIARWSDQEIASSRLILLRALLDRAGVSLDDVPWTRIELATGVSWGQQVRPGDLLQVGDRWVVLYQDDGDGELDPEDLCFDFLKGAMVRPISAVFVGTGDVDWLSLSDGPV